MIFSIFVCPKQYFQTSSSVLLGESSLFWGFVKWPKWYISHINCRSNLYIDLVFRRYLAKMYLKFSISKKILQSYLLKKLRTSTTQHFSKRTLLQYIWSHFLTETKGDERDHFTVNFSKCLPWISPWNVFLKKAHREFVLESFLKWISQ